MIKRAKDLRNVFNEHMKGGDGTVKIIHYAEQEEIGGKAHVLLRIISLIFIFLHKNFVKTPWQASALPRGLCLVLARKILKMRCLAVQIV